MRAPSRALGLVVLAGLSAAPLSAQSGPATPLGANPASPPTFEAAFHAASGPRGLVSETTHAAEAFEPFQEAGRNRAKGALWGGGLGLVAGGLLGGLTAGSEDDDGFGEGLVEAAGTGEAVVLGALAGAAIGAVLGATVFAPSRGGPSTGDAPLAIRVAPRHEGDKTGVRLGLTWVR